MDFQLPEELLIFKKTVKRFVEEELEPLSERVEETEEIPQEVVEKMRSLGLFGLTLPEKYGGAGLGTLGYCLVREELAKTNLAFAMISSTNNGIGSLGIYLDGTEEQKQKYLPPLARGEMIASFALTEPNAGSDAAALETTAVKEGDYYILNGTKQYITNAPRAQVFTVMAVTDKEKRARGGITAFVVDRDTEGLSVGKPERKMGLKGGLTAQVHFDNSPVPVRNILGQEGHGFITAMKVLDRGRVSVAAGAIGASEKLLDLSINYAKTRVQFGRPIAHAQQVQAMLAEMASEIYAARMATYHAAWSLDQGQKVTKEAAMVKLFATEMACRVADKALQIHGGAGYMKEYPIERFYRDLRLFRIVEGTSEIQKLVIARELTKD